MIDEKWQPRTRFPNLKDVPLMAVDTETKDPNLITHGSGAPYGEAHAIGFSVAVPGDKFYLPIRHEGGGNLPEESVINYMRHILSGNSTVVFANAGYDLEILRADGIEVQGAVRDIQVGEPLLDENQRSYSLDNLGKRYFKEGKEEVLLTRAAYNLGVDPSKIKSYLYKLPSSFVGPYAEQDADLTLRIHQQQIKKIEEEGLMEVYDLECDVIRVLFEMRWRGIPVDVERAELLVKRLAEEQNEIYYGLTRLANQDVDIWSNISIEGAANKLGLLVPRTELGNPSFEADFLDSQEHPFYQSLLKCRKLDRAGSVFIQSKIVDLHKNGKMYPRFRQVRGDDRGTRSGRFSSEGPNFQQIPSRDDYLAPLVRSCFTAWPDQKYASIDYRQQEMRVAVHYGYILGIQSAADIRQKYIDDPDADYYLLTQDLIKDISGKIVERKYTKPISLGANYGMGKKKLAASLGLPMNEAYEILDAYHTALPFVKIASDTCNKVAELKGEVKTILGRKRHFDLWGPKRWNAGVQPLKRDEALQEYGDNIVRYFCYRAFNAVIQGSAADMIKKAMVACMKESKNYLPLLTIHDELTFSLTTQDEIYNVRDIMCNCLPNFTVPLAVDIEWGDNWGEMIKLT